MRPPAPAARWPLAVVAALFLLRVWTGLFFCDVAKWKLFDHPEQRGLSFSQGIDHFVEDEYVKMVEGAIEDPPVVLGTRWTWFGALMRDVALPGRSVFGPMILFGEALLGISLVLGVAVRLSASLGFLMMLAFSLAKRLPAEGGGATHIPAFTANSANWPVTVILLTLAIAAAGRAWGLDAWLRTRLPRGLAWTT